MGLDDAPPCAPQFLAEQALLMESYGADCVRGELTAAAPARSSTGAAGVRALKDKSR